MTSTTPNPPQKPLAFMSIEILDITGNLITYLDNGTEKVFEFEPHTYDSAYDSILKGEGQSEEVTERIEYFSEKQLIEIIRELE